MVVFVGYTGLYLWAKKLGRTSRIQPWEVGRMKNRYESSALNAGAIFFSLVVVPIGGVLAIIGIAGDPNASDDAARYFVLGIAVTFLRELYMVLCDLFAKRTPTVT
jgi:hypothetical protein